MSADPRDAPDPQTAASERPVFAQLDALGVAYERLPCDPALADTEQFCAHYGIDPAMSGNTIIVGSRRDPCAPGPPARTAAPAGRIAGELGVEGGREPGDAR